MAVSDELSDQFVITTTSGNKFLRSGLENTTNQFVVRLAMLLESFGTFFWDFAIWRLIFSTCQTYLVERGRHGKNYNKYTVLSFL